MNRILTFGDSFTAGHGCKPFPSGKNDINQIYYEKYIDLSKPIWPEYISEKLNLELINYGINGASNDLILDNILLNINDFNKEDIIIIQISTSGRYDFPFMKEKKMLGGWYADGRDKVYDPDNKSPYFLKTIFTTNLLKEYEKGGEDALIFSTTDINSKNLKLTKSKYQLIKDFFGEFITTKKYYERQIWRFIKLSDFLISLGLNVFIIHEDYWPSMYEEPKNLISNDKEGILQKMIKDKKTIKHDSNGVIIDWHPSYDGHISIGNDIIKFINENTNLYNT